MYLLRRFIVIFVLFPNTGKCVFLIFKVEFHLVKLINVGLILTNENTSAIIMFSFF